MRNRFQSTSRLLAGTLLLALAAVILAGLAIAGPGQGKGASASQYAYAAGKAYGHHKVAICHKGSNKLVPPPALKGHLKHGDKLGAC